MKPNILNLTTLTLLPAAILALTSCSSTPEGERETMVAAQKGKPGGVIVETYQTTATVTGIDASKRKVTLVTPDGKKTTYKAGPEVVNFDQIQVGDQLKLKVAEQLVVFMASDAPPQTEGAVTMVALAPVGAKPGGLVA